MNPTGKGGFEKGVSGNPSGRSKEVIQAQRILEAAAPSAARALVEHILSPKLGFVAATSVLDRTLSRPVQVVESKITGSVQWVIELPQLVTPLPAQKALSNGEIPPLEGKENVG